jgi:DNA processing protein
MIRRGYPSIPFHFIPNGTRLHPFIGNDSARIIQSIALPMGWGVVSCPGNRRSPLQFCRPPPQDIKRPDIKHLDSLLWFKLIHPSPDVSISQGITIMPHPLFYWLALAQVPGVGNTHFRSLVEALGTPEAVLGTSRERLKSLPGIGPARAEAIANFNQWAEVEASLEELKRLNASIVTFRDPAYPRNLLYIHDFPPLLYLRGSLKPDEIGIAIVGSRQASPYGKIVTDRIARDLALAGITVVSGLARGIDSAAHRAALAVRGRTIALLGSGIDVVYPPENQALYQAICEKGAVISEYPIGTLPHRLNFPARNRLISGLSYGVLVVEAGEKSGSLITARLSLEQGREVFAVPGPAGDPRSRGTNMLIRSGAKLVESAMDIIEEIRPQIPQAISSGGCLGKETPVAKTESEPPVIPTLAKNCQPEGLLRLLGPTPVHIDELNAQASLPLPRLQEELLKLELRGLVHKHPGNYFSIKE